MTIILKLFGNEKKIEHAYFGILSNLCVMLLLISYGLWSIEYNELYTVIMYYDVTLFFSKLTYCYLSIDISILNRFP